MRTKNKIRSRRTAQTKKELKNKEKQKEKARFRPSWRDRSGISKLARHPALWRPARQAQLSTTKMAPVGPLACHGEHVV